MPEISDLIQKVGQAKVTSLCDIKSAYHQIEVKPEHQWLTAFVWDGGLLGKRDLIIQETSQELIAAGFISNKGYYSIICG